VTDQTNGNQTNGDQTNGDQTNGDRPHTKNIPLSQGFDDAMSAHIASLSWVCVLPSGETAVRMPSVAYFVTASLAPVVGYVVTDADRTPGRAALSDDERRLAALLKNSDSRRTVLAALKAAGITL